MLKIKYLKHILNFRFQAGTSRGVLTEHPTYILQLFDENEPEIVGLGEAGPLKGLSMDDRPDFEKCVQNFCQNFNQNNFQNSTKVTFKYIQENTIKLPALRFAIETALLDLQHGGKRLIYPNSFYLEAKPLSINGLIWMGDETFMNQQIEAKLEAGFSCIKMKIGAIDFETELKLLRKIRQNYSVQEITLRVDANGAFSPETALSKLEKLAELDLHSIEQPIRQGQIEASKNLCKETPLPIALDEELIGIDVEKEGKNLLQIIESQFIILKPTLLGGLENTRKWIQIAEELHIGWWITSALESNIGLNAICQFTAEFNPTLPQGLGTGQLYHNNFDSPLTISSGFIQYEKNKNWILDKLITL